VSLNDDDLDNIIAIEKQKGNEHINQKVDIPDIQINMIEEDEIMSGHTIGIESSKIIFEFTSDESIQVGITTDTINKIEFLINDQFINLNK